MGKILLVSTPVGPLGSGLGGGVELTLLNIGRSLALKGYEVEVVAPSGSVLPDFQVHAVPGKLQPPMQFQPQDLRIWVDDQGVLEQMWNQVSHLQSNFDLILNFAYDWLPLYLTRFNARPIAHLISMGSVNEGIDRLIQAMAQEFPQRLAFHSQAQADTFGLKEARCLGNALDLDLYQFCQQPQDYVAWVGRLAPEKGLEDAIAACNAQQIPLRIYGKIQDHNYWENLQQRFTGADFRYQGFLSTLELQAELGKSRALLMTPHWVEAFGNVAIEALACGVPVVAYRRGGPAEIVEEGKTGWLVEPDNIEALGQALTCLDQLDRWDCRQQAEQYYSLQSMVDRLESWFTEILI